MEKVLFHSGILLLGITFGIGIKSLMRGSLDNDGIILCLIMISLGTFLLALSSRFQNQRDSL